jgi:predicted nucleotidyltransferase
MDPRRWIESLGLPRHEALLERLVDHAQRDPRIRFVELGCSVARGAGDELSDLDLGIGIADESWPETLGDLGAALRDLGTVVDLLEHEIDSWAGVPHRRFFVQYEDGSQVDLVAMLASRRPGLPPGSVALHDADGRLALPMEPPQREAEPDQVREWAFEGFVALLNVDKYLRRRSLWEALEQLHEARTLAWRLWAVAEGIPFPAFGVTAVLDEPEARTPPGLERTVAALSDPELRASGAFLLRLLREIGPRASARARAVHPDGMAAFVDRRWTTSTRERTT